MDPLNRVAIPNPEVVGRIVEGEAVLVSPEQGKVTVLNEVGATIWTLVDGTRKVREIAAAISLEYAADPAVIEADTLALLERLAEKGIVSLAGEASPTR